MKLSYITFFLFSFLLQTDVLAESEDILYFGLLFAEEFQYSTDQSTEILTFQHRMLQEFTAAFYICQMVMNEASSFLKNAIPNLSCIYKQGEVIKFVCGLLRKTNDGALMVDHVCRNINEYIVKILESSNRLTICELTCIPNTYKSLIGILQEEAGLSTLCEYFSIYPECGKPFCEVFAQSKLTLITDISDIDTEKFEASDNVIIIHARVDLVEPWTKIPWDNVQAVTFKEHTQNKCWDQISWDSHNLMRKHSVFSFFPTSLRHLSLARCHIYDAESWAELGQALKRMHHLTFLDLSDNGIGFHSSFLVDALKATASQLQHLNLSRSNFSPRYFGVNSLNPVPSYNTSPSFALLSVLTNFTKLQELFLAGNRFTACVPQLMQSLPPSLRLLNLAGTFGTGELQIEKAVHFPRTTGGFCSIPPYSERHFVDADHEAVPSICSALENGKLPNIEHFDLSHNYLSPSAIESLLKSIESLPTEDSCQQSKVTLNLNGNNVSQEYMEKLRERLPNVITADSVSEVKCPYQNRLCAWSESNRNLNYSVRPV